MRRGPSRRIAASIVLIALAAFPAVGHAARIRPINLEQMTERADRIFSGRCVSVRVARDPDLGQVVTYVTLRPDRVEKGHVRGSVTIKLLGDQDADGIRGHATEGVPVFRAGEDLVLFLYGDSPHGLTSPVGFGQGKFAVRRDKEGHLLALNELANEQLARGLSDGARKKLGQGADKLQRDRAIPPGELLDLVRSLLRE
jgi:hypothetical protein